MKNAKVSEGKVHGIRALADKEGIFTILGIGAVDKLKGMLADSLGIEHEKTGSKDLSNFKRAVIKVLSQHYSAMSTELRYGYPFCAEHLPEGAGLILSIQKSEEMHIEKIKAPRPDAVKFIIHYDAPIEITRHQKRTAIKIGEECRKHDLAYILQINSYPTAEGKVYDRPVLENNPSDTVRNYVKELTKTDYQADILKIEFPADLRYCEDSSKAEDYCKEISNICPLPWVVSSSGLGIEEFIALVKIATNNGASGSHGGRALWGGATRFYPDVNKMEDWLSETGIDRFNRLYEASKNATSYFNTKRLKNKIHNIHNRRCS